MAHPGKRSHFFGQELEVKSGVMSSIICISNGHGEDVIASKLLAAYHVLGGHSVSIKAFPLVGEGRAYARMGLSPLLQNPTFPSGGFIRGLPSLIADLKAGLLTHLWTQRQTIKAQLSQADTVVVVGDFLALWMGHGFPQKTVFLPTAKSNLFMPHSALEMFFIKRWAKTVYPRDSITAEDLNANGVEARFLGNIMWDRNTPVQAQSAKGVSPIKIGVLPGSRHEAYLNIARITQVLNALPHAHQYEVYFALPETLDSNEIQARIHLTHPAVSVEYAYGFETVIDISDIIIGLAGTANEQAAYWGKPVLCFEGFGPQTTYQRFEEQQKLLEGRLEILHPFDPIKIAQALVARVQHPDTMGYPSVPNSGNALSIARDIWG